MSISSIAELADKLPLVLLAYMGAFFPWAVVSAYDYINSEWKTVRQTWRYGVINLVSTVLPLFIVLFYAVAQAAAGEYTEMANAIVASSFICLHIIRTLWSLWQLHEFRCWAENSILNLRKLGIEPALSNHRDDSDGDKKSIRFLSENILVNDTIIDNQITHGLARCRPIFSRNALKQRPVEPIQLWLNWSSTFVVQLLPLWVRDFKTLPDPSDESTGIHSTINSPNIISHDENKSTKPITNAKDAAAVRARYFAAELAASASLHLLSCTENHQLPMGNSDDEKSKTFYTSEVLSQHHSEESNNETHKKSINISNPFFRDEWCQQDHMHDGRIRKSEMLNFAAANISILPFSCSHEEALHRFQELRHAERLTYEPYKEHLRNIVSSFPIDWKHIQEMTNFDVNKLEWFLILLHLGQLSSEQTVDPLGYNLSKQCPMPKDDTPFGAISNLQSQLGMENQRILNEYALNSTVQKDYDPLFNLSSIPIGHSTFLLVSQSNKLVLKAGELIDVWMALVAGQQISSMMSRTITSRWEQKCHASSCEKSESCKQSDMQLMNIDIEQARLKWRIADFDQCYGLADHYITFMGYKMEYTRSFVALLYGVFGNCETKVSSFFNTSSFTSILVNMRNSSCTVGNRISKEKLSNRAVQVNLVWQLQNQLEEKLEKIWTRERDSKTVQSETTVNETEEMLLGMKDEITTCLASLFVLSFPSISVESFDFAPTFHESTKRECVTTFREPSVRIKAICGAQNIQLELKKDAEKRWALRIVDGELKLNWRKWKEAFMGRLIGCRKWQKTMDVDDVPYLHDSTQAEVSGGVFDLSTSTRQSFSTFSDWFPFRPAFALFEFRFKMRTFREIQIIRSVPFHVHMKTTGACYGSLSDRRTVQVSYEKCRNSTLVENILFLKEWFSDKQSMKPLEDPQDVRNIISIAKKYQHTNLSRCLQVYEMAVVQYSSIEALVEYLSLVESQSSLNHWISAISVIEGTMQRKIDVYHDETEEGHSLRTEHVQSVLGFLQLFITAWGGMHRMENIFNIITFLSVTASVDDGKNGILCLLKMLFYLFESDDDIVVRGCIAEYLFAVHLRLQQEDSFSEIFASERTRLERFLPRCLLENTIKIYNFTVLGQGQHGDSEKLSNHMSSHTSQYPLRHRDKRSFIVRHSAVPENAQELYLLSLKNLAIGILFQKIGDTEAEETGFPTISTEIDMGRNPQSNSIYCGESRRGNGLTDRERAIRIYNFAVDESAYNEEVMGSYADCLDEGLGGIPKDTKRAVRLWEIMIEKSSSPEAMVRLANMVPTEKEKGEVSMERAVHLLERAIEEFSDVDAMCSLAIFLEENREGLARDIDRSIALYNRAIEETSDPESMTNLATLLLDDVPGVEMNPSRAVELLGRAIKESSHTGAMFEMAKLLEKGIEDVLECDATKAVALYEKCIKSKPCAKYMVELANVLVDGKEEVSANVQRAVLLYEQAIDMFEDINAMWELGHLLEEGRDELPVNAEKATDLYERAIRKASSDPEDMRRLAKLFISDESGGERDTKRAIKLLEDAINKYSNPNAMMDLAILLEDGEGDVLPRDTRRAVDLYEKSISMKPYPLCMNRLGLILLDGKGDVEADVERAAKIFKQAIDEFQDADAMWNLAELLEGGRDEMPRDIGRAIELYENSITMSSDPKDMMNLAELLTCDEAGEHRDANRAVELLEDALTKSSDPDAMWELATLLQNGEDDVLPRNTRRAVHLYEQSIAAQASQPRLKYLADLLRYGDMELEANVVRAVQLYKQAVVEFEDTESMWSLVDLLEEGSDDSSDIF